MSKPFVLGLLVLSAALTAARDNSRHWIEVRSPGFTIVTNSSEKQGRRIAAQFERMRAVFQQSYPQTGDDPESPVVVLAVKNKDLFRVLEPASYLSDKSLPLHGVFVGDGETNYILMRLDAQAGNPYPVVYHEYTHLFLREADQKLPLWLNEGLAEFYQNTEIYEDHVVLGQPDQQHLMLLREQKLLPLAALFNIDEKSPYYLEEKKGAVFYAECWALTHYLMLQDYAAKTSKVPQYTRLLKDNVDAVTAATRVFGDLRKLQRDLEAYIAQTSFNHFEARISSRIDDSRFQVKSIPVSRAQASEAAFLIASGRADEARSLFPSMRPDEISAAEFTLVPDSAEEVKGQQVQRNLVLQEVPCPLSQILQGARERATEMVDNLQRFTATEAIEHTQYKKNGQARKPTTQLFNYLAEIDQGPSGAFWVEEYRTAKTDIDSPPLSDTGTAAFALIFHPQKIGNFDFQCEGLTTIQGNPAWQLRFQESPDLSKSFHQIRIDRAVFQLRFKGRAWVTKDSFQVLRLQTDLVAPIPQIHLQQEHLEITYAPVDFDRSRFTVWLPDSASMQISYRGRRYRRVHKFSHFQLFLVVTDQTIKDPVPGPGGV
jgi:Protein of unknown function (DUF1570)